MRSYGAVRSLAVLILAGLFVLPVTVQSQSLTVDHTSADEFENIPDTFVSYISTAFHIYYGHTSHGSQIMTGIAEVQAENALYDPPYFYEVGDDLGHNGDTSWAPGVRSYLDGHPNCNMVMLSWCGGCSDNTESGINVYLNKMAELESDYPSVTFIYMTGHLDGTGVDGNLYQRNNQIRDYCTANGKVLFDFADIESWDPAGNYYPDETDACNWCYDWCDTADCPSCGCAHSHCFNCYRKGKAWWWMMARLSGWNADPVTPEVVATTPGANAADVAHDESIAVVFNTVLDTATLTPQTVRVRGSEQGLMEAALTWDAGTRTLTLDPVSSFRYGELVTVTLTTGILSTDALPLGGYSFSFTAATAFAPLVFSERQQLAIDEGPRRICAADLDMDSDPDLVVCARSGIYVLENQSGVFVHGDTIDPGTWPFAVATGDIDNDGDVDIVGIMETSEYFQQLIISLNNGDGTFAAYTTHPALAGIGVSDMKLADMDNDGDLDAVVVCQMESSVMVIPGYGDGSFGDPALYTGGGWLEEVEVGDVDNDGDMDVVTTYFDEYHAVVLFNDGSGVLGSPQTYQTYNNPLGVALGDANSDGFIDIWGSHESGEYMGYMSLLENQTGGVFSNVQLDYLGHMAANCIATVDLDGDGDLDAVCGSDSQWATLCLNDGTGSLDAAESWDAGGNPQAIVAADFDGDGDMDLAIANGLGADSVTVLLNEGIIDCTLRGDMNCDGAVGISDMTYLVAYLFSGGPEPCLLAHGDVNDDAAVNIADMTYMVDFLFLGGPAPLPCD